ncbi:MAG: hypothetical protein ACJA1H_002949, partial [Glaciecola sp.]
EGVFKNIIYFFDFDIERNLPTLYSALALLLSGILLFIISVLHKDNRVERLQWRVLSFIFVFLSIDEATVIHEQLWMPTKDLFNTSGLLYYAWYIPYGFILLFLILVYAKWLWRLPKKVKSLFIISGVVFVFGAIGLESVSGFYDELMGQNNLYYCALYTLEELFEMCGVAIFIYALLIYIFDKVEHFNVTLK